MMMKKENAVAKTRSRVFFGFACVAAVIWQAAPAVTAAPNGRAAHSKNHGSTVVLSAMSQKLLRDTAVRLGMKARGAAPKPPKRETPEGERRPIKPPSTAPGANGHDANGYYSAPDVPPARLQAMLRLADLRGRMTKQGDEFAKEGAWDAAVESYAGALDITPGYQQALYGIANCAGAAGDDRDELLFYRRAIYSNSPLNGGFREGNFEPLMKFALLLSQAGQEQEALMIYNHTAVAINFEDGRPSIPVLLPVLGPGGATYTPQRLQAMAMVGLALQHIGDTKKQIELLTEALRLAPDSVAANFYMGDAYDLENHTAAARRYYERARKLGDAAVRARVDSRLGSTPMLK